MTTQAAGMTERSPMCHRVVLVEDEWYPVISIGDEADEAFAYPDHIVVLTDEEMQMVTSSHRLFRQTQKMLFSKLDVA